MNNLNGASWHGASLELRDLTLAYGPIEVLRKVSLRVAPGRTATPTGAWTRTNRR